MFDIIFGIGQQIIEKNKAKDLAKQEQKAQQIIATAEQLDKTQKQQYYITAVIYLVIALVLLALLVWLYKWINK